ncbi:hypothetical protein C8R44DRAFT_226053 [Mycena epipterygia]|nr:hypothetical protein C8R44DRAFT_226053 [Mycena epipterygia]
MPPDCLFLPPAAMLISMSTVPLLLIFTLLQLLTCGNALNISVPTGPIHRGEKKLINWTAENSDPLSFTLALVCQKSVTLNNTVERGTPTNTTGQVSFHLGCVGPHFVEALPTNTSNSTAFATSPTFQVVSQVSSSGHVPTSTFSTSTPSFPLGSFSTSTTSTTSVSPASSPPEQTVTSTTQDPRMRTLIIVSAILGAVVVVLLLLLTIAILWLRKSRRPRDDAQPTPGGLIPFDAYLDYAEKGDPQLNEVPQARDLLALTERLQEVSAEMIRLRGQISVLRERRRGL